MRTPVLEPQPTRRPPTRSKRSRALPAPRVEHPEIAWRLIGDYNLWRNRCSAVVQQRTLHRVCDVKATDERLGLLTEMHAWCSERVLDSRLWLFLLFREMRWFYPPKLGAGSLMKEGLIEVYNRSRWLDAYRRHVAPSSKAQVFDPNRDVAPANEMRKTRLLEAGRSRECLEKSIEETMGYHPKSKVCTRCPVAPDCAARLKAWCDFDIMALRLGTITAEQAQESAQAAQAKRMEPRR